MAVTGGEAAVKDLQAANSIFAGPATGAATYPAFRAMVIPDMPNLGSNEFAGLLALGSTLKGYTLGAPVVVTGSSLTLTNGGARWVAVNIPVGGTITGIKLFMDISGVYTSTGYNGVALNTLNVATGLLTQVAASTSSTTIWSASPGMFAVPFATPYVAVAGIYYMSLLSQWSVAPTAPQISSVGLLTPQLSYDFPNQIKICGAIAAQTVLNATQAMSTIGVSGNFMNAYPY